jgi:hypothetical protein
VSINSPLDVFVVDEAAVYRHLPSARSLCVAPSTLADVRAVDVPDFQRNAAAVDWFRSFGAR